jgi:3-hydroxyisobutyrate dehydrogenase
MMQVAYLGMGIMGSAMAANLAKAGHQVKVWNRTASSENVQIATAAGATQAASIADAVTGAQAVCLSLADVPDVEQVLFSPGGVVDHAAADALIIDMGTSGPALARHAHSLFKKKGMRFLDAPVSGGDVGARAGTLTIMVGGDEPDCQAAQDLLSCLGKNIYYCGRSGCGQGVKLCNQILCAVNMLSVCEAFALAEALKIDPQLVVDACSTGSGGSWALANLGQRIVKADMEPGFAIKHMLKDLRLVREAIFKVGRNLPATELATQEFEVAAEIDATAGDEQGTQAMIRAYRLS